jgi:hypothetical protein
MPGFVKFANRLHPIPANWSPGVTTAIPVLVRLVVSCQESPGRVTAMNANPAKYPLISKVGNGKSVISCGVFPLKPPFWSIADSFTEGFPNFLFRIPAFCWRNQRSKREADLQTLRFRSTPCCLYGYGYHPLIKYSVLENPPFVDECSWFSQL